MKAQTPLWAITTYFNVANDRLRLRNYKLFRAQLAVPLLVVEWSLDARFELGANDAEILIQVHGGDLMWQKERLLNIAIAALPSSCEAVAWLDCDIVFETPHWPRQALRELSQVPLIQPFSQAVDLTRDQWPNTVGTGGGSGAVRRSVAALVANGQFDATWFGMPGASMEARYAPGFAWAARLELIKRHGLYDGNILGIGDKLLFNASMGRHTDAIEGYGMNDAQAIHYLAWARDYFAEVQSRIGFVPQRLFHLWHGDLHRRRYGPRVREFERFGFDPFVDIRMGEAGSWEWASDKPRMHAFICNVLLSHHEADGGQAGCDCVATDLRRSSGPQPKMKLSPW